MEQIHRKGKIQGNILLFALSTCVWCKKTKQLLDDMDIDYYYVDVDLLEGEEKHQAEKEMYTWNPRGTFPTIIINNEHTIVGYSEKEIKEKIRSK
jgi:glutaredoxin